MNWECINSGALSGDENMSLDMNHAVTLVKSLQNNEKLTPFFRIYAWDTPTLSLGKHQFLSDDLLNTCNSLGIPIVHRPTGGRAVLHSNELTYCVTMPCPTMHEARKAYHAIHNFFLTCLERMHINDVHFAKSTGSFHEQYKHFSSSACFTTSARHELTCKGKKLIGSAQRLMDGVLLQHGSLPLDESYLSIADILGRTDDEKRSLRNTLRDHSICLNECLGYSCEFSEIADIIMSTWRSEYPQGFSV